MRIDRRTFQLRMALVPVLPWLGTSRTLAAPTTAPRDATVAVERQNQSGLMTTDGRIAVANLDSTRRRLWHRFFQDPVRDGAAESVIECEQLSLQFLGDVFALDRLMDLVSVVVREDADSAGTPLIRAQVASMSHRFADASQHLAEAERRFVESDRVNRIRLSIAQACGSNLSRVLEQRRRLAESSGSLEDRVALGAVLVDLGDVTNADRTYHEALADYRDISPFPIAWTWFQRGVLWGERVPEPDFDQAENCYQRALEYLPEYSRARIHLAEIFLTRGKPEAAAELLAPVLDRGDPEVSWRLAEAMARQGREADSASHMAAARAGFEVLLERHLLAFADHAAAFYAATGTDIRKGLDLARINVSNRPTIRAYEQAYAIALAAKDRNAAAELLCAARSQWGSTPAFALSSLVR